MKKTLAWLLTAALALSLTACGSSTTGTADNAAQGQRWGHRTDRADRFPRQRA